MRRKRLLVAVTAAAAATAAIVVFVSGSATADNTVLNFTGSYGPGEGQFIHLWQYKDGMWRIKRVISFDHHQAAK